MTDNQELPSKELQEQKGGDLGDKLPNCPLCHGTPILIRSQSPAYLTSLDGACCVNNNCELNGKTLTLTAWKKLKVVQQALDSAVEALKLIEQESDLEEYCLAAYGMRMRRISARSKAALASIKE